MSDEAFVGEIRLLPYDFTPETWLPCDGQMLETGRYQALYSLIENTYGGDRLKFGIPNLNGRIPVGVGTSPGGSQWSLAQQRGEQGVVLSVAQIPGHSHELNVKDPSKAPAGLTGTPGKDVLISRPRIPPNNTIAAFQKPPVKGVVPLAMRLASQFGSDSKSGAVDAHDNIQPYVALHYCICFEGEYPVGR